MNIDDNPKTPKRFSVRGIPTLILFKNGQVEGQKIGAVRKADVGGFPGQQTVRGYLGNQGRNRPDKRGRGGGGGNRDGNRGAAAGRMPPDDYIEAPTISRSSARRSSRPAAAR